MKKLTWNVCYTNVNDEEASIGETDRRGFLAKRVTLSNAIALLTEDMTEVVDFAFSSYPMCERGWLSVYGRNWATGDDIENTLHPSRPITVSSWNRVMQLVRKG